METKYRLYQWVQKLLARSKISLLKKSLDKQRQYLLELAISGRHHSHYLWLLAQSCSTKSKNLKRQAKGIFVWYRKERADIKTIHDENNVLTDDDLANIATF